MCRFRNGSVRRRKYHLPGTPGFAERLVTEANEFREPCLRRRHFLRAEHDVDYRLADHAAYCGASDVLDDVGLNFQTGREAIPFCYKHLLPLRSKRFEMHSLVNHRAGQ